MTSRSRVVAYPQPRPMASWSCRFQSRLECRQRPARSSHGLALQPTPGRAMPPDRLAQHAEALGPGLRVSVRSVCALLLARGRAAAARQPDVGRTRKEWHSTARSQQHKGALSTLARGDGVWLHPTGSFTSAPFRRQVLLPGAGVAATQSAGPTSRRVPWPPWPSIHIWRAPSNPLALHLFLQVIKTPTHSDADKGSKNEDQKANRSNRQRDSRPTVARLLHHLVQPKAPQPPTHTHPLPPQARTAAFRDCRIPASLSTFSSFALPPHSSAPLAN